MRTNARCQMKLTYKGKLPSLNELINAGRTNKYVGAKVKRELTQDLAWIFKAQAGGKKYSEKVVISIHCYEGNLRRDDDNVLSGACKVILDALQVAGIIPNDSPRYVHLRPERFQSEDKSYYTIVEIEEAD